MKDSPQAFVGERHSASASKQDAATSESAQPCPTCWRVGLIVWRLLTTRGAAGLLWIASSPTLAYCDDNHRFRNGDEMLEGRPIHWDGNQQLLTVLGRDGRLWELGADALQSAEKTGTTFGSYTQGKIRSGLIGEFGPGFDVSGTGKYLVVHPSGERDQWAQWFEDLYRKMVRYFSVRGIQVHPPAFPLVAVVFRSQQQFLQHAERSGGPVSPDILGYYDIDTNRILLFDVTGGGELAEDWRVNAETIIHEATHQTAFNVGIHNRFCPPPRWVCEGLGTMFEARGVYDSVAFRELPDRVNRDQLRNYRRRVRDHLTGKVLQTLVASEVPFQRDPYTAYALGWGRHVYLRRKAATRPGVVPPTHLCQTASRGRLTLGTTP